MNALLRLNKTTRLVILSILLGFIGAFGALAFLAMLRWAQFLLLNYIGGYNVLSVDTAASATKAPLLQHWLWLIPVSTTLGGLISGWLVYTFAPEAEGHGTDAVVKAYHRNDGRIRARIPLVKSIASAITIGSGGSAGREGPTAQIAAGVGSILGTWLKLPADERRYLVLMGMAAGLSAIFRSPLGTAIFAIEILYSGVAFESSPLIYTLIAAAVSYAVIGIFQGWTPLFLLAPGVGFDSAPDLIWYGLLAIVAGVVGAVLPTVFYKTRDWFSALPVPPHFKPAIGGLAVGIIGMFVPPLLAGGYGYVQLALQGGAGMAIWLLLLLSLGKIVALSLTVSSGGSGGVFAPSLYVGAMLGAAFATLLHSLGATNISGSALAVVGMAALFAGAARVPIASLVMVAEMTGGYQLIMPTMFAVAISYVVQFALTRRARYPSLYEAQVAGPAESPVHHEVYYQTVAKLLRLKKIRLEDDIMLTQFSHTLHNSVGGIPLRGEDSEEHLYSITLEENSGVAGREIRYLGCPDVLIVSIVRDEQKEIIPGGGAVLRAGDQLVIAATPESFETFMEMAKPVAEEPETVPEDADAAIGLTDPDSQESADEASSSHEHSA